jgi:serine protease Do
VGIDVENLTPDLARRLGWDRTFGALVTSVEAGSPAAEAGVQRGDIVTNAGNVQVEDAEDFRVRLKSYPAKTPLALGLFRAGQAVQLTVTPIEFPTKQADSLAWDRLGLRVKAAQGGLVVTGVRPGTAAAQVGLEPGDLIARLNNQPMGSVDAFREALIGARGASSVVLLVKRGRVGYHVTLPF